MRSGRGIEVDFSTLVIDKNNALKESEASGKFSHNAFKVESSEDHKSWIAKRASDYSKDRRAWLKNVLKIKLQDPQKTKEQIKEEIADKLFAFDLAAAQREVVVQEFFRLIIPHYPVTRYVVDYEKKRVYVLSEEMKDFQGLENLALNDPVKLKQVIEDLKSGQIMGLGQTVAIALLLNEIDFKTGNIIIKDDKLTKFDGDWGLARLRIERAMKDSGINLGREDDNHNISQGDFDDPFYLKSYTPYNWLDVIMEDIETPDSKIQIADLELTQSEHIKHEFHSATLCTMMMSKDLLNQFVSFYVTDKKLKKEIKEEIRGRLQQMYSAALHNEDFRKYLISETAKADIQQYFDNALSQFMPGDNKEKNYLIDQDHKENLREQYLNTFAALRNKTVILQQEMELMERAKSAINTNNKDSLEKILAENPHNLAILQKNHFDCGDIKGNALHYAIYKNKTEMFNYLLEKGFNPKAKNADDDTAMDFARRRFNHAVKIGKPKLAEKFINETYREALNQFGKNGLNALHLAIKKNEPRIVDNLLISKLIDPHAKDENGRPPLHVAIEDGKDKKSMVTILLESGYVDVNAKDNKGNTALHQAIKSSEQDIAESLISPDSGCDINAKNEKGSTPLHLAIRYEATGILKKLLNDPRCDLNAKDEEGRTPRDLAIEKATPKVLKLLKIEHPIFAAIEANNIDQVNELMQKNRSVLEATNHDKMTALHFAIQNDKIDIAKLLIKNNNDPTTFTFTDGTGYTPLHYAVSKNNPELIGLICSRDEDTAIELISEHARQLFKMAKNNPDSKAVMDNLLKYAPSSVKEQNAINEKKDHFKLFSHHKEKHEEKPEQVSKDQKVSSPKND